MVNDIFACLDRSQFTFRVDCNVGVIAFVGEEGSYASSGTRGVVVGEFSKGKDFQPIVLVVVAENAKILVQCLVKMFSLTVTFWMIT